MTGADILATATDGVIPVVEDGWIESGMYLVGIGPLDFSTDCQARIDLVVRQGKMSFDMPESGQFWRNLGHMIVAFGMHNITSGPASMRDHKGLVYAGLVSSLAQVVVL